jgi:glycosyltransferase involved in cell wall biosynthesis
VVQPSVQLYGADRMAVESVAGLVEDGWRVFVAVPEQGPLVPLLRDAGADVRVVAAPVLRKSYLSARGVLRYGGEVAARMPSLLRLVGELRPDVVYVNTITVPPWIAAARLRGVPVVCHVHEAEESASRPVRAALASPLLLASRVMANSTASADVVKQEFGRLGRRTRVIYNGVEGPAAPRPARESLTGAVRLVIVGRVSPRKGTDVAVEALARLVSAGRDVSLDIVGGVFPGYEWFEDQVRASAETLGVADRVHWLGETADPWAPLADADIALVPSRVEPFGNAAVEAMLAGRPLVAGAAQGLVEIVDPGRTGELVAPGDADALAEAIGRLVDDWPGALARAAVAQDEARRRFSTQRYRTEVAELVDGMTTRR